MTWKLNVTELLHFFDEAPDDSRGHASALVGVLGEELCTALLQKYLKEKRGYLDARIVWKGDRPVTPTTGSNKGRRLDRWLAADDQAGRTDLYQIEIKNWSAHAIGGKFIAVDAQLDSLRKISSHYWEIIWNRSKGEFRYENVGKVLTRMQLPPQYEHHTGQIIPLLCLWWYLSDPENDDPEPLFEYKLAEAVDGFRCFQVFSISNYVRALRLSGVTKVDVDLPQTVQRIAWMERMFGRSFVPA